MADCPEYLSRIPFSDECLVHTNATVKNYKASIWSSEKQEDILDAPIKSKRLLSGPMHKIKAIETHRFRL